ncbi:hypothetical protein [Haladaptatus sp. DYF46]|uniref:DUF7344 domain-containing protein n=1 Tax=Haladaptatus sp. DYF46 TaxID=2886041 RepID=UPI001E4C11DD|nr:hypothetical protein [Haladaptatus sp. DYF46]
MSTTKNHTDTYASGDEPELSADDVFHLLQNHRRRAAIHHLHGKDEPVEMRDLAEQVAAWENDTTVQALTSEDRQRAYIPLYQPHLPKLDEEGSSSTNKRAASSTPVASRLEPYLMPVGTRISNRNPAGFDVSVGFPRLLRSVRPSDRPGKTILAFPPPIPASLRRLSCLVQTVLADIDVRSEVRSLLF